MSYTAALEYSSKVTMRTYLDGTAADCMHTAMHALPVTECTWTFCILLGTRFGQIDPDAGFWDKLPHFKQGSLPAALYVHKMQYCFIGIAAYLCW